MDSTDPTTSTDVADPQVHDQDDHVDEQEVTGWSKLVHGQRAKLAHATEHDSAYGLDEVYLHPNTPSLIVALKHHNILGWMGFLTGGALFLAAFLMVRPHLSPTGPDAPANPWDVVPVIASVAGVSIWIWFCTGLASKVYGPHEVHSSREIMIVRERYQASVRSLRKSAALGVENAAEAAEAAANLGVVLADLTNQEHRLRYERSITEAFHWEYRDRVKAAIEEVRGVIIDLVAPVVAASELAHSKRANLIIDMSDIAEAPVELDLSKFGLTAEQRQIVNEATAVLASLHRD